MNERGDRFDYSPKHGFEFIFLSVNYTIFQISWTKNLHVRRDGETVHIHQIGIETIWLLALLFRKKGGRGRGTFRMRCNDSHFRSLDLDCVVQKIEWNCEYERCPVSRCLLRSNGCGVCECVCGHWTVLTVTVKAGFINPTSSRLE